MDVLVVFCTGSCTSRPSFVALSLWIRDTNENREVHEPGSGLCASDKEAGCSQAVKTHPPVLLGLQSSKLYSILLLFYTLYLRCFVV